MKQKPLKPSDYWATPLEVFQWAEARFGKFDLDVCALAENTKCGQFYDEAANGLSESWLGLQCWLNPPYSDVSPWLAKAHDEAKRGATVVALLKYDNTTKWWREYVSPDWSSLKTHPGVEVVPYPKRVKFVPPPGIIGKNGRPVKAVTPPWPSVFVVFRRPE